MLNRCKYVILAGLSLQFSPLVAQQDALSDYFQSAQSPLERDYWTYAYSSQQRVDQLKWDNPSFAYYLASDSTASPLPPSSVAVRYAEGSRRGDFLPSEGNSFDDLSLKGNGLYHLKGYGTLYGSVSYVRGRHNNIGWNACRQPERYAPYFSTDSVGGDFRYENYSVSGAFSFSKFGWNLGVQGAFCGEQAYRLSDPRALNNTTDLMGKIGVSKEWRGCLFLMEGDYTRNKQHLKLNYWRPGQQDRFFVAYGFGQYDKSESAVLFSYSRMYYIDDFSGRIALQTDEAKRISAWFSLGAGWSEMDTEESDIQNLYYSKDSRMNPNFRLRWKGTRTFFSLWAEYDGTYRRGFENIIERYLVDANNNIYDFRVIDTQQNYTLEENALSLNLEPGLFVGRVGTACLELGVRRFSREEKYRTRDYLIRNECWVPTLGVKSDWKWGRESCHISFLVGKNKSTDADYRVEVKEGGMPQLDFQHAFSQYAFYHSDFNFMQARLNYVHAFSKIGLGVDVKCRLERGERAEDCSYQRTVAYPSSAPSISLEPDSHDAKWVALSLFAQF